MTAPARISTDLSQLKPHYAAIVVGSGYGAGVAASRLARAGQQVCVLERGREYRPGDYPAKLADAKEAFRIDTARGTVGAADGLFNLHMGDDVFALVGCGLGGTSLINANVGLEIDRRLLDLEHWPAALRDDADGLEAGYARARRMLDISPYPQTYPPLHKLEALEMSAKALRQPFYRPPIAVNFEDQTNPFGVPQPACNNCGNCCSGCNVGAKNTTLMNYLPDAKNHGAQIITQAHVDWLERDGGHWRLHLTPNGEGAPHGPASVTADIVVLGAGSLGSTEILLRSKAHGLSLSGHVGRRFSGNGDVLAFGYDSYWKTQKGKGGAQVPEDLNGIGLGSKKLNGETAPGPCITGVIDMRANAPDPRDGLVIEEGVIPGAMAMGLPPAFFFADAMSGSFTQYGLTQAKSRLMDARNIGETFQHDPGAIAGLVYEGPVARTQTYLVMSVDDAGGTLKLKDDRLRIDWPGAGKQPSVARDNDLLREAAQAIESQFFPNPLWTGPLGERLITVHPVGGCGMGDDGASGVVNHKCQVFAGASGDAVHPGLYVCDGSVMPGPVGVNPLLTISAVSERALELMAKDRGWTIDWTVDAARPPPAPGDDHRHPGEAHEGLFERLLDGVGDFVADLGHDAVDGLHGLFSSVVKHVEAGAIDLAKDAIKQVIRRHPDLLAPQFQFTETMQGYVGLGFAPERAPEDQKVSDDYATSAAWGRARDQALSFELTIHTDDLNRMVSDPAHRAKITGTVACPALSPDPMTVTSGEFQLLRQDEGQVETWKMTYDMVLDRRGAPVRFFGFKVLKNRQGSNAWADVTTLFVTLHEGADRSGPILGQGVLTLGLEALAWQASSFRLDIRENWAQELIERFPRARNAIAEVYLAKFGAFFGMTLFQAYGGLLAYLNNFPAAELSADPPRLPTRRLYLPRAQDITLRTADGFSNRLTRYNGGLKGPVLVAPGFGVRASSFAIDTVDENFAEALVAAGYDTWLYDCRSSPSAGNDPTEPFDIDDIALKDWPAAIAHVRAETGADDVQIVAHCVPSMALLMSLAAGTKGVRSVISSQVTLHPVTDWLNYLKTDLNAAGLLAGLSQLGGTIDFTSEGSDLDHEIDLVAWNVPIPEGQACHNPTCRRIFAVYGPSYDHAQLNHWTHTTMARMFGRVPFAPFKQLQTIMRAGRAVAADGSDRYVTEEGAKNLALPITFISGLGNQLFYPETAQRTRAWLSARNDPGLYRQKVFQDYAHMDLFIGRNAARDVFPYLIGELDRFN